MSESPQPIESSRVPYLKAITIAERIEGQSKQSLKELDRISDLDPLNTIIEDFHKNPELLKQRLGKENTSFEFFFFESKHKPDEKEAYLQQHSTQPPQLDEFILKLHDWTLINIPTADTPHGTHIYDGTSYVLSFSSPNSIIEMSNRVEAGGEAEYTGDKSYLITLKAVGVPSNKYDSVREYSIENNRITKKVRFTNEETDRLVSAVLRGLSPIVTQPEDNFYSGSVEADAPMNREDYEEVGVIMERFNKELIHRLEKVKK